MSDRYRILFSSAVDAEIEGRYLDAERILRSLLADPVVSQRYGILIRESLAGVYHKMGRRDLARTMLLELADNDFPEDPMEWAIDLAERVCERLGDLGLTRELLARVGPDPALWPERTLPLQAWIAWKTEAPDALERTFAVFSDTAAINAIIENLMQRVAAHAPDRISMIEEMLNRLERTREDHRELVRFWREKLRS